MLLLIRLFLLLVLTLGAAPVAVSQTLSDIEARLVEKYPRVQVISSDELTREIARSGDFLLLDVRTQAEFRVSHIAGAIWVDPQASAKSIAARIKEQGSPEMVVLYCSVGYRSARMANRLQKILPPDSDTQLYNLSGGVFLWHNQNRPLEDDLGPTEYMHPYNAAHKSLLKRKAYIATKPPG
jgi:rhodanese-related sulfurtransferase